MRYAKFNISHDEPLSVTVKRPMFWLCLLAVGVFFLSLTPYFRNATQHEIDTVGRSCELVGVRFESDALLKMNGGEANDESNRCLKLFKQTEQ